MHILNLTPAVVASGVAAFNTYLRGSLASPASAAHSDAARRATGLPVVVGAIDACIDHGINDRQGIISAVAKVSRCRHSTVAAVLDALSAGAPSDRRWSCEGGAYLAASASSGPVALLAA